MEWERKLVEKMNQKLWVIVPAQCTQLSIVQVLRASAITAQLMPVAWLQLELRITTLGPVQEEKKQRRAGNWIHAAPYKKEMSESGMLQESVRDAQNVSWDLLLGHLNQASLSFVISLTDLISALQNRQAERTHCSLHGRRYHTFFIYSQ